MDSSIFSELLTAAMVVSINTIEFSEFKLYSIVFLVMVICSQDIEAVDAVLTEVIDKDLSSSSYASDIKLFISEYSEIEADDDNLIETMNISYDSIADLGSNVLKENRGLKVTMTDGVNFISFVKKLTSLRMKETVDDVIDRISSKMSKEQLKKGLGFLLGSGEQMDAIAFFQRLQKQTQNFYSVPRSNKEVKDFSLQTAEAIAVFNDLQNFLINPRTYLLQLRHGSNKDVR